jgi:hypothetical protein
MVLGGFLGEGLGIELKKGGGDMNVVQCWFCDATLRVPNDRCKRDAKTAGENTIDPALRVCTACWKQIKRANVAATDFASHVAALEQ